MILPVLLPLLLGAGYEVESLNIRMKKVEDSLINVKTLGASGDGSTDDTAVIQRAIAAVEAAGGGTVWFPAGTYKIVAPQRTTDPGNVHAYDGIPLIVSASNVKLRGEGRGRSVLQFRSYGDASFATNWQIVSGKVWRGPGIYIKGGANAGATIRNVSIAGLELDGGAGYTGDVTFPANPSTGDGWDLTHKGVWFENDRYGDNVVIEDCYVHSFRGELVYAGGRYGPGYRIRRSEFYSTNGDGVSSSMFYEITDNVIHRAAGQGIENTFYALDAIIDRNVIYDIDGTAIDLLTDGAYTTATVRVTNNVMRASRWGFKGTALTNVVVQNNTAVDCGSTSGSNAAFSFGGPGGVTQTNLLVEGNQAIVDTRAMQYGFHFADTFARTTVRRNTVSRTPAAVDAGYAAVVGFNIPTTSSGRDFRAYENASHGSTYLFTDEAAAFETLLATTAATTVARVRPHRHANYRVEVFLEVVTADTTVTLTVSWYNSAGVQQTKTLESAALKAVGTHVYAPVFVHAYGDNEGEYVRVTATAGTANQAYVSANIDPV